MAFDFTGYQKNIRENRLKYGLCAYCGGENDRLPKQNCSKCKERLRVIHKKYRLKLKKKGLCQACKKPLDREGSYCSECLVVRNETSLLSSVRATYNGLCKNCKVPLDREGTICSKCLEKSKKEVNKRRDYRRKNGLCIFCGIPMDRKGTYCTKCCEKRRVQRVERLKKKEK